MPCVRHTAIPRFFTKYELSDIPALPKKRFHTPHYFRSNPQEERVLITLATESLSMELLSEAELIERIEGDVVVPMGKFEPDDEFHGVSRFHAAEDYRETLAKHIPLKNKQWARDHFDGTPTIGTPETVDVVLYKGQVTDVKRSSDELSNPIEPVERAVTITVVEILDRNPPSTPEQSR